MMAPSQGLLGTGGRAMGEGNEKRTAEAVRFRAQGGTRTHTP
jgi:hypothetical protein